MGNILVTGCNGQLGTEIKNLTAPRTDVFFTDVPELDITDFDALNQYVSEHNIDTIINCAAYTNVDKAEEDEATAQKINSDGPGTLAKVCNTHDATLVHISTDYVFDGTKSTPYHETDRPNPKTAYGRTKRSGELAIKLSQCKSIIIRTAWLYSPYGKNFVKTILSLGSSKPEINVVADQFGTPTNAGDLAQAILHILPQLKMSPRYGEVFHFTDEGVCTWYEFASKIISIKNLKCVVNPVTTEEYPSNVARPHYSVLDKTLIKTAFRVQTPMWERSLRGMLNKFSL